MLKRIFKWLFDATAKHVWGSLLGSAAVTAVLNYILRQASTPSWELMWVVWTVSPLVAYVLILKSAAYWMTAQPESTTPTPALSALQKRDTGLRLRFFGNIQDAQADGPLRNVWRYYVLRLTTFEDRILGHIIFLTFDEPVQSGASSLEVVMEGASLPSYEVKDFSPRTAIVMFQGPVPAGVLILRVRYPN